jgi:hypothetical protein
VQVSTEDKRDDAKNGFYRQCEELEQARVNSAEPYENLLGDLNNK